MSMFERTKEVATAPLVFAVSTIKAVGNTALELVDSRRLVQRLSREQQLMEIEHAFADLETAQSTHDTEMIHAEACHVVKTVAKSVLQAVAREEIELKEQLHAMQQVIDDELQQVDLDELGLDKEEVVLVRWQRQKDITS